ncbi:MAG: hypothetical protein QXX51_02560 [Candidatus Bathyarchaeia archaeon]
MRSFQVSLTAVFAALHAVLYFISFGLWRNWGIYLESIEGIILGPKLGFTAAFIGSSIARMIRPDELWMFGIIAEPVSVLVAGLLAETRWKPVLGLYAITLSAYFIHPYGNPFGQGLPLWTILDVLFALFLIYPTAKFGGNLLNMNLKRLPIKLTLISFVCIATDSLIRIFLLVPCGLYNLFSYFNTFKNLYAIFVEAATASYIEDSIVVIVSFTVGVPLLISLLKLKLLKNEHKE